MVFNGKVQSNGDAQWESYDEIKGEMEIIQQQIVEAKNLNSLQACSRIHLMREKRNDR